MRYIQRIGYKPIYIKVIADSEVIGYFIGERLNFAFFSIISAPFNGIGTYTQGLVMLIETDDTVRLNIYNSLANWIFENKISSMLQVDDWQLRRTYKEWIPYEEFHHDTIENYGIQYSIRPTLCVNVNIDEDTMWNGLHYKSAKYSINKAKKTGLFIKEITDFEDISRFTKHHYSQLVEVCKKHSTHPKPSQKQARMQAVCEELYPNRVIMLECIGNDENGNEQIMSSGIFCLDKGECIYWTGASFQKYQKYCPNELMVWEAMKLIHQRGGGILNFGGMASYKRKFGTVYEYVPRISFYKYKFIYTAKERAQKTYFSIKHLTTLLLKLFVH